MEWRRSVDSVPPLLPSAPPPLHGIRGESVNDCRRRVLACWRDTIAPRVRAGARVLVASHANTLRALVSALDGITPENMKLVKVEVVLGRVAGGGRWRGGRCAWTATTLAPPPTQRLRRPRLAAEQRTDVRRESGGMIVRRHRNAPHPAHRRHTAADRREVGAHHRAPR